MTAYSRLIIISMDLVNGQRRRSMGTVWNRDKEPMNCNVSCRRVPSKFDEVSVQLTWLEPGSWLYPIFQLLRPASGRHVTALMIKSMALLSQRWSHFGSMWLWAVSKSRLKERGMSAACLAAVLEKKQINACTIEHKNMQVILYSRHATITTHCSFWVFLGDVSISCNGNRGYRSGSPDTLHLLSSTTHSKWRGYDALKKNTKSFKDQFANYLIKSSQHVKQRSQGFYHSEPLNRCNQSLQEDTLF